jgi:uncharacterized protein (TIGR03067 family)
VLSVKATLSKLLQPGSIRRALVEEKQVPFFHYKEFAMKLYILPALALGLLIAANSSGGDVAKKDLKKLEGTWGMVSGEAKGEKLSESAIKIAKLTIVGDKYSVKLGEDTIIGIQKLDPTQKPKAIDAMDTDGPNKGKTALGIYKLEKGEFTVCLAPPGMDRPTEFTTKSGTGELLHVWKLKKE